MARKLGFTLIEVMVSVSVIALLVAITMPSFKEARRISRKIKCQHNLKQIGIAVHNYLVQNNERFPLLARMPSWEQGAAAAAHPPRRPYVPIHQGLKRELGGKSEVFECPADQVTKIPEEIWLAVRASRYYDAEGTSYEWEDELSGLRLGFRKVAGVLQDLVEPLHGDMWMAFDFEAFHGGDSRRGSHNVLYVDLRVQADTWDPDKKVGERLK